MPFTSLLLTALVPEGKIKEKGVRVKVSPLPKQDGIYLLFKADGTDFQNKCLKKIKKENSKCCDVICFALQKSSDSKNEWKTIILLVELKGGNRDQVSTASKQILETRELLETGIKECIGDEGLNNITWEALIISKSGLSMNDVKKCEYYRQMYDKFKKADYKVTNNVVDLVQYINEKNRNTA